MRASAIALLLLVAAALDAQEPKSSWRLAEASGGPELSEASLSDGKVRILLFWATWCPYCKALLPHLQSMADEYGQRVSIAAVNFRDDGDPAKYFGQQGYTLDLYPDGDNLAEHYGVKATPGLIVLNGSGESTFNLYDYMPLARKRLSQEGKDLTHGQKAARLTPLWAAEIRRQLDATLARR